jgi:predicted RNase H-like nuclease (RuvC/YqgF family)
MNQSYKFVAMIAIVLSATVSGYGQSLGDVARTQRQKQSSDQNASHKVITNEDLPENADEATSTSVSDQHGFAPEVPASNDEHAAKEWKARIQAQKSTVASLQSQINRVNSSIHFVEATRYNNGVQHNQRQAQKQDDVERMQQQLEEQKKQLEDMQESARKAGLGSSVYEP